MTWSNRLPAAGLTVAVLILLFLTATDARAQEAPVRQRRSWWSDPRSAVLVVLGLVAVIGGGRKLIEGQRARRAVARLADSRVPPSEIREVSRHGREGLMELFRLLSSAPEESQRLAAGQALVELWANDQLVAEEEKAVVTRGYRVDWVARRRYPREMSRRFFISVRCWLPSLEAEATHDPPLRLEWSYRVVGSRRASLETFSDWCKGAVFAPVPIEPPDFPGNGLHRLVFQARVRPAGLTGAWEHELPHVPFSFEFDPALRLDALMAMPDESRAATFAAAVRTIQMAPPDDLLDQVPPPENPGWRHLPIGPDLAISNPPSALIRGTLPCDLAHRVFLEFEGIAGRWRDPLPLVVAGRGVGDRLTHETHHLSGLERDTAVGPERPGDYRVRLVLVADPEAGWAHPEVRSIWPGEITTDWCEVSIIRR